MTTPNRNPIGTQLVKEYLLKNPALPTRTIARHLFNNPKNRGIWSSLENVRKAVGRFRGAQGKGHRGDVKVIAPPSPLTHSVQAIESNPFFLPVSDRVEWKPHVITVADKDRTLIINDIHFPYHDRAVLELQIREGKRRKINRIILNGDTLDFYQLSRFSRDPRLRDFAGEIEMGKQYIEVLREHFPDAEIVWKQGNHEERYEHYLQANAKELIGVDEFRFEVLMGFFDLRVTYVTDKRPIQLGHNIIVHGHEFGIQIFSPVNPARGLYLKAKHTAACGHHHTTSEHSERALDGKIIVCWSIGCSCDLNPLYRPINSHNLGFAFQETMPDGTFDFDNLRVIDGRVV